jgi:choline dehydrogenase-like flavoprotein
MRFDIVIVGSGAAGAVLATRLSEDPSRRVALIEAGPDYPSYEAMPDKAKFLGRPKSAPVPRHVLGLSSKSSTNGDSGTPPFEWGFVGHATDDRPAFELPQGRIIGGTSSINAAFFTRGTREDFESWVAAGNSEWTYDKVLPYYRKSETDLNFQNEFHGSAGPMPVQRILKDSWDHSDHCFEEACLEAGYGAYEDHNHPDATGVGPVPRNSIDGTRRSTARTYLSQARGRPNLTIMPDTVVRRVVVRGTRAVGVETVGGHVVEGEDIVLSAGAIKSPHILLLSGMGPAHQLKQFGIPVVAHLPGVGQNLRDHPSVALFWRRDPDASGPGATPGYPGVGGGATFLRFTASGSSSKNDCRILSPRSAEVSGLPETAGLANMNVGLYAAAGAGQVRLQSADAAVQPLLEFRYLDCDADRRRLRDTVSLAIDLSKKSGLDAVLGDLIYPTPADVSSPATLEKWIKNDVRTAYHLAGTAKLGPDSDPYAVVDQFARVHGVERLRVADASIMPDCVRQNTNATTIMIGERVADMIGNRSTS